MLKIIQGDITKVKTGAEYICNAANGIGLMPGGVALAIRKAGGIIIELSAIKECFTKFPKTGHLYITKAGKLPYMGVIHLVTMKVPGTKSTYEAIENCLKNLIEFCETNNIRSVTLPALGTGIGRLSEEKVAAIYKKNLGEHRSIEFVVVDRNESFIRQML